MKLDVKKLRQEKNIIIVSSKESLKDIDPIQWSDDVLEGKKKIEVKALNKENDINV